MRPVRIDLLSRFGLLLSVLLLALSLIVMVEISLAAPSTPAVRQIPAYLPEQQEEIPNCGMPPGDCNKIQVVVMIDQSGSMTTNDPQNLRLIGAEHLVEVLAHRYLDASMAQRSLEAGLGQIITPTIELPTIQLAILHFGSDVLPQHNSGWITIAPKSEEDLPELRERLNIRPEDLKRWDGTDFIRPFEEANKLWEEADKLLASQQDDQGCPQRVILLLTDGAPARAKVYTGANLNAHMRKVERLANIGMSGKGNFIYVTAFNAQGPQYWEQSQNYWMQITKDSPTAAPPRIKGENTPQEVASRMLEIVATHLGYQYQSFSVGAKPVNLPAYAYLQSMRITYYAPNADDPPESFTVVDPDGKTVVPDGDNIILTGQGTPVQVMVINFPKPGSYQVPSQEITSTVTLLPTYLRLAPKIETPSIGLQQFTSSEISLALQDTSGNPVPLVEDSGYQLELSAEIHQGDQLWPFTGSEEGSSFQATILPASSEPTRIDVTATLRSPEGQPCRLSVESGELDVAPVTFQVGEISGQVCTLAQTSVIYPLTLINADTQAPADISVPVAWEVSSTSLSEQPVAASIQETGAGRYQLSLQTDQAEDIRTSLTASAEVEGQSYPFFKDELITTGLPVELLSTYLQLTPKIETSPSGLQQFTSGEILFTLQDTSGNPVPLVDDSGYRLELSAEIQQGDQPLPFTGSEDGSSFQATILPVSSEPARMEVTATLRDSQQNVVCWIVEQDELEIAPVTFQVGEVLERVCTPSQMPITYPLNLINKNTEAPAVIGVPVAWEVSSTSLSGHPVAASIQETGAGQYQLSLRPDQAEDIRTSLTASAEVEGQSYPFFKPEGGLLTAGLLEDRSLAFELGKPGTVADNWSLFFNRLFRPWIKDYPGQILIGRRLFGLLGPQDVTISGQFFNQRTGEDETGIQRFFVQLAPEEGGPMLEKANGWIPGEGGIYTVRIPAPRLGPYRVNVIDEGESAVCTTIGGLPTLNLLLINDFWEYIFWIVLLLLAILLLAWLIWMMVLRNRNPLSGRLELVDPDGQVRWPRDFDSGDGVMAGRSSYTWKLEPPVFGIVKIKAHSWDRPSLWIRIELHRVDDRQVYDGYLGLRCTYICWEDRPWKDTNHESDFRLTWRRGRPGVE